jgi:hypothetical protein
MSPELGDAKRAADIRNATKQHSVVNVDLEGIKIYAVAQ